MYTIFTSCVKKERKYTLEKSQAGIDAVTAGVTAFCIATAVNTNLLQRSD